MKLEVLTDDKNRFDVLLHGEDLGFANTIVEKLLESKAVTFASAELDHPLKGNPIIRVKAKDAKKELSKAVAAVEKDLQEMLEKIEKLK